MTASAAPTVARQEQLIATRDMRVSVGEDRRIVDVKRGDPWPPDANGRLDVFIRVGYVVRIDEDGEVDKRSYFYARGLGIPVKPLGPVRSFLQRARQLPQHMDFDGRKVRVYAGQPDGADLGLCFVGGRAYPLVVGSPDAFAAREALRLSIGGDGTAPRRRPPRKTAKARSKRKAKAGDQKRRRRRAEE